MDKPLKNRFAFLVLLTLFVSSFLMINHMIVIRFKHINATVFFNDVVLTYFHPTTEPHRTQKISATTWDPVIIILSSVSPRVTFTLENDKINAWNIYDEFQMHIYIYIFILEKNSKKNMKKYSSFHTNY